MPRLKVLVSLDRSKNRAAIRNAPTLSPSSDVGDKHSKSAACLIPPKVLEPCRRQFRISDRVANISMPKVILNGSRVVTIAGELVSRTMSQHVRVNLEGHSGLLSRALHQPIEPIGRERCSSLIDKYEW